MTSSRCLMIMTYMNLSETSLVAYITVLLQKRRKILLRCSLGADIIDALHLLCTSCSGRDTFYENQM